MKKIIDNSFSIGYDSFGTYFELDSTFIENIEDEKPISIVKFKGDYYVPLDEVICLTKEIERRFKNEEDRINKRTSRRKKE